MPALWAPAACAVPSQSQAMDASSCPARRESARTAASLAGRPGALLAGVLSPRRPGDVAVRGRSATAVPCGERREGLHMAVHGGVESRAGIERPRAVESSVCSLVGSASCSRPSVPVVIRLLFQLFPCSVGVACVWQPCGAGRSIDRRLVLCNCAGQKARAPACVVHLSWRHVMDAIIVPGYVVLLSCYAFPRVYLSRAITRFL